MELTQNIQYGDLLTVRNQGKKVGLCANCQSAVLIQNLLLTKLAPMTTMTTLTITNIINIQKYPIQDLTTPSAQTLISHCRNQMSEDGSLLLEQFIRPDYIKRMTEEVSNLTTHRRLEIVDVMKRDPWVDKKYYEDEDMLEQLPVNHPLKFQMSQDVYAVASDLVPTTSLIRLVYDSPMVMNFLAAVVNQPQIYQYGDEFQVRNIMLCFIDFKLLNCHIFLIFSFPLSFPSSFSLASLSLFCHFSLGTHLFFLSHLFFFSLFSSSTHRHSISCTFKMVGVVLGITMVLIMS